MIGQTSQLSNDSFIKHWTASWTNKVTPIGRLNQFDLWIQIFTSSLVQGNALIQSFCIFSPHCVLCGSCQSSNSKYWNLLFLRYRPFCCLLKGKERVSTKNSALLSKIVKWMNALLRNEGLLLDNARHVTCFYQIS